MAAGDNSSMKPESIRVVDGYDAPANGSDRNGSEQHNQPSHNGTNSSSSSSSSSSSFFFFFFSSSSSSSAPDKLGDKSGPLRSVALLENE